MNITQGGEQPHQHQAERREHAVTPHAGEEQQQDNPDLIFAQDSVHAYINYLDQQLGEPLHRPLREGFRWFLEDALAVPTERLSDDEVRCLEWLSGWDHWTVENIGKLINRARSLAYEEGRGSVSGSEAVQVRVEAS